MLLASNGANITGTAPCCKAGRLVDRRDCEDYLATEVKPHWPEAWIDFSKTKVGYEIPINRHFYVYEAPRPLAEIERDIKTLEGKILDMLKDVE